MGLGFIVWFHICRDWSFIMYERILIDPKICHGIPVHQIIRMLANGDKIEELLEDYPSLKTEDIYACLDYAASLAEEQITPIANAV